MLGHGALGQYALGEFSRGGGAALVGRIIARASSRASESNATAILARAALSSRSRASGGVNLPARARIGSRAAAPGGVGLPGRIKTTVVSPSAPSLKAALPGIIKTGQVHGFITHQCIVVRYVVIPSGVPLTATRLTATISNAPVGFTAASGTIATRLTATTSNAPVGLTAATPGVTIVIGPNTCAGNT